MAKKYFTVSYDDGVEQDKEIIRLMKKYGIRGTFNLNSGCFGQSARVQQREIKNMGTEHMTIELLPYFINCHRIAEDEIRQVYEKMEIASHGTCHVRENGLDQEQLYREVVEDRERLETYTKWPIVGHAPPYGAEDEALTSYIKKQGFSYARGIRIAQGSGVARFRFEKDRFHLMPTCIQTDEEMQNIVKEFISTKAEEEDLLLCLFGHGYELEYTGKHLRERLERVFDWISVQDDIICCTNAEVMKRNQGRAK